MLDDWRRSNSRFSLGELRQQVIIRKRRALRGELLVGAFRLTRQCSGFLESALDRVPFRKDLGDVLNGNLPLEFCIRHGLWPAEPILEGEHAKKEAGADEPHSCRDPPAALSRRVSRREALGAPRAGHLLIARSVGWLPIGLSVGRWLCRRDSLLGHDPRSQVPWNAINSGDSIMNAAASPAADCRTRTRL